MDRLLPMQAYSQRFSVQVIPANAQGRCSVLVVTANYALALSGNPCELGMFTPAQAEALREEIKKTLAAAKQNKFLKFGSVACLVQEGQRHMGLNYVLPDTPAILMTTTAGNKLIPNLFTDAKTALAHSAQAAEELLGPFDWTRVTLPTS